MRGRWRLRVVIACAAAFAAVAAPIAVSAHSSRHNHRRRGAGTISHVLLISVDGLYQSDLDWYVHNHPSSALAKLASGGSSTRGPGRRCRRTRFPEWWAR